MFGLCSDHLYLRNVTVRSLQTSGSSRPTSHSGRCENVIKAGALIHGDISFFLLFFSPKETYVVMCGSSEESYVDLPSETAKLFYLSC